MPYQGQERGKQPELQGIVSREDIPIDEQPDDIENITKFTQYKLLKPAGEQSVQQINLQVKNTNEIETNNSVDVYVEKMVTEEDFQKAVGQLVLKDENTEIPSVDQVKKSLKNKLTTEQVVFLETLEKQELVLSAPGVSANNIIQKIDNEAAYNDSYVQSNFKESIDIDSSSDKFQAGITGILPPSENGDNIKKTLNERFRWFNENLATIGFQQIPINVYLQLMKASMAKSSPIDAKVSPIDDPDGPGTPWTMFGQNDELVLGGTFVYDFHRLNLDDEFDFYHYAVARFRPSVMVNVRN
jgi:hypothetical protein